VQEIDGQEKVNSNLFEMYQRVPLSAWNERVHLLHVIDDANRLSSTASFDRKDAYTPVTFSKTIIQAKAFCKLGD
jgi:hypothetical protein